MSSPDRPDLIGRRLGSYRIEAPLGRGSMAEVYRARDVLTRAEVALKVHARKENEASRRRFFQEARAVSMLAHPGIVRVFEVGIEGDLSFIAMELVLGEPLSAVLSEGALPWREAVRIALGLTDALEVAHAAGVMHRDLKPGNVLITREGATRLVDFGLAKRVGEVPDAVDEDTVWDWSDVRTQPGAVLGTPAYMAPEQARASEVDARADVFSLGVILWEIVAGKPLFRRATPAATLRAILTEQAPPLSAVVPEVPQLLDQTVARAVQKSPDARFADIRSFGVALRELGATGGLRTALGRVVERHSQTLAEPRFVGRSRELLLVQAALDGPERAAVLVGLLGSGRRRLGIEALARLGHTRPLVHLWANARTLEKALTQGSFDSVFVDVGNHLASELLPTVRRVVGARTRLVLSARRADETDTVHAVRVAGLSEADACEVLGLVHGPLTEDREVLATIARALGGHPLAITAIANRLLSERAPQIAAALDTTKGWPDVLSALGTLRAWLAHALAALGSKSLTVLSAIAAAPSLTEADALVIAEAAGGGEPELSALESTALVLSVPHPERLSVPRVEVPPLVRRALVDHGDAAARAAAVPLALSVLAERADRAIATSLVTGDEQGGGELVAEAETILALSEDVLGRPEAPASEVGAAAECVVAVMESELLDRATDRVGIELDHTLARLITRGIEEPTLRLRALTLRAAPRPALLRWSEPSAPGRSDALMLARGQAMRTTEARLMLADAEEAVPLAEVPEAVVSAVLQAVLPLIGPDEPAWGREHALERIGELHLQVGALGPALGAFRNAIELSRSRGDGRAEARLRHRLARVLTLGGEHDEAMSEENQALPLAIAASERVLVGLVECALAELSVLGGAPDRAQTHLDRAASSSLATLSRAALVAGHTELSQGHFERARALYASASAHGERFTDAAGVAVAEAALAATHACVNDRALASDALVRATLKSRELSPSLRKVILGWRGHLERLLGGRDGAGEETTGSARACFDAATCAVRSESEPGTGPHIGRFVLDATKAVIG